MSGPEEREDADATSRGPLPPFLVVGVGASAGGLQAIEDLLGSLRPEDPAAFVVVTHQAPDQPSLLPDLLRKRTSLSVTQVDEPTPLRAGGVFLPPPGRFLDLHGGVLSVQDMASGTRLPIDHLLRAFARELGPNAAAIILSGSGSDGTEGVRAVKGEGGLALAQDEASATHASMPRSAIATGLVDFVLPPGEMGEVLRSCGARVLARGEQGELPEPLLQKVFVLLRQRTGHDFSSYKRRTVARRIERRMLLHEVQGLREYLGLLAQQPDELDQLFRELLIGVTSFFRDPEAFQSLCQEGLPRLLADKPDGYELRAWVAGCSTGEEAYSLSIALREGLDQLGRSMTVQVFATDINGRAIDAARAGLFPEGIVADVGPERLQRFFTPHEGQYRISKVVRDAVVFAVQDVLKDPPFTKLDLISCRNLFIYLQPELQRRLLTMFHYALRPDGLLLLGSSESVGPEALFSVVDKRWKLFRRRATPGGGFPALPVARQPLDPEVRRDAEPATVAGAADRMLLDLYGPPSVLVTARGDIVHVRGRTGPYLEPAEGQPHMNVLAMARDGLGPDLALALRQAAAEGTAVERRGVRVKTNGHWADVTVVVRPSPRADLQGLLLISFEGNPADEVPEAGSPRVGAAELAPANVLEERLQRAQESLQATVEELEASNEELKSTNEELQSTNEELQSTNEELETSKEELQSLNEELQTVNAELQEKIHELSRVNDDMTNLLNSTDIATVFLDNHLNIKRFTPQARRVIKLIDSDAGRPIGDLASRLDYAGLVEDGAEVLRTLIPQEREVRGLDGAWFLTRIRPYRTADDRLDGLVITFVDVTTGRDARTFAACLGDDLGAPLLALDGDLVVVAANFAFHRAFQAATIDIEGEPLDRIPLGPFSGPALRAAFLEVLDTGRPWSGRATDPKRGRVDARRIEGVPGSPVRLVASFAVPVTV